MQKINAVVARVTKYQVKLPVTTVRKAPMAFAAAALLSTAKTTTAPTRTRLTVLMVRSSHCRDVTDEVCLGCSESGLSGCD